MNARTRETDLEAQRAREEEQRRRDRQDERLQERDDTAAAEETDAARRRAQIDEDDARRRQQAEADAALRADRDRVRGEDRERSPRWTPREQQQLRPLQPHEKPEARMELGVPEHEKEAVRGFLAGEREKKALAEAEKTGNSQNSDRHERSRQAADESDKRLDQREAEMNRERSQSQSRDAPQATSSNGNGSNAGGHERSQRAAEESNARLAEREQQRQQQQEQEQQQQRGRYPARSR